MKYVFAPISVVGCGKSTTFRTLELLRPAWAHIQNDRCSTKNEFFSKIREALDTSDVVLLDRNNHLRKHRQEITMNLKGPGVRLVALLFVDLTFSPDLLRDLLDERIVARGDNHPTINAASSGNFARGILMTFLKSYQDFDPTKEGDKDFVPLYMTLDGESSKQNARRILEFINKETGEPIPDESEIELAFQEACAYVVPDSEKKKSSRGNKGKKPEQGKKGQAEGANSGEKKTSGAKKTNKSGGKGKPKGNKTKPKEERTKPGEIKPERDSKHGEGNTKPSGEGAQDSV